ncbi:unnamed protein product, partial [Ectocarpus fasciculatus]
MPALDTASPITLGLHSRTLLLFRATLECSLVLPEPPPLDENLPHMHRMSSAQYLPAQPQVQPQPQPKENVRSSGLTPALLVLRLLPRCILPVEMFLPEFRRLDPMTLMYFSPASRFCCFLPAHGCASSEQGRIPNTHCQGKQTPPDAYPQHVLLVTHT